MVTREEKTLEMGMREKETLGMNTKEQSLRGMDTDKQSLQEIASYRRTLEKYLMVVGIVIVFLVMGWFHIQSVSISSGLLKKIRGDEQYLWGTYRSHLYFGMRMARPKSLLTGMMWFGMQNFASCKSKEDVAVDDR
jgi:hypothetical protein